MAPRAVRADVMEARKRTYELTSQMAAERTENAKLREAVPIPFSAPCPLLLCVLFLVAYCTRKLVLLF